MTALAIRRGTLAAAILARTTLLPEHITVYCETSPPRNVPAVKKGKLGDPSGLVAPYVWLQLGAGSRFVARERDLAGDHEDLSAVHQFTCVGGTTTAVWDVVDEVEALFLRWAPVIGGLAFGRMEPPDGYEPGNPRVDDKYTPPRLFVPLLYRLDATT